jgi:hypothetical protein
MSKSKTAAEDRLTLDRSLDWPTALLPGDETHKFDVVEIDDHEGGVYVRFRARKRTGTPSTIVFDLGGAAVAFLAGRLGERHARYEKELAEID